jgi:RNA polymerase sigma factor (sigma-70 family)
MAMPRASDPAFQATRWSLVSVALRGAREESRAAMETLCQSYWYPIYAYVRSRGYGPEDAADLTQGFFAKVIAKDFFAIASPERGKLRTFLLSSCQNYVTNEWQRTQAQRRGGGQTAVSLDAREAEGWFADEPSERLTPEALYHRRWALTVLEQCLSQLQQEYEQQGKLALFAELKPWLEDDAEADSQREIATRLGISEASLRVTIFRLRQRYRSILFNQVAESLDVSTEEEVKAELAQLIAAL